MNTTTNRVAIWTHDGTYHADDVFACSTLLSLFPGAEIIRSRTASSGIFANFAVDVGGEYNPTQGKFDHHRKSVRTPDHLQRMPNHPEGVPMASFGMVWHEFGNRYIQQLGLSMLRNPTDRIKDLAKVRGTSEFVRKPEVISAAVEMVRKSAVLPIDSWDAGNLPNMESVPQLPISSIIHSMSAAGREFHEALEMAERSLHAIAFVALARKLRSEAFCNYAEWYEGDTRFVSSPVKPYSFSWAESLDPMLTRNAAMIIHLDGNSVDYVSREPMVTGNSTAEHKTKGRLSRSEFIRLCRDGETPRG